MNRMYAQLIEGGTTPTHRDAMDRIVTDELIPALDAEPGFSGALNIVDRLTALAGIAAISTGTRNPISVWEVNARA
jgi:hypothetical protein